MRDSVLEDSCGSYGLVVLLVPGESPSPFLDSSRTRRPFLRTSPHSLVILRNLHGWTSKKLPILLSAPPLKSQSLT